MKAVRVAGAFLFAATAACGRQADFSGPAPAGALQCAVAHAEDAGYEVIAGDLDQNFLRLRQPVEADPTDRAAQPRPDLGDVVLSEPGPAMAENELLLQVSGDRLQISLLGISEAGASAGAASTAEGHARTILALCTTSPPVFPDD